MVDGSQHDQDPERLPRKAVHKGQAGPTLKLEGREITETEVLPKAWVKGSWDWMELSFFITILTTDKNYVVSYLYDNL